jgi:hypothetical protein
VHWYEASGIGRRQDIGWGWRFFLLAVARRLGFPIRRFVADLPCPPEQRGEDDTRSCIYRMEQLAQNVRGLALGLRSDSAGTE